MNVSRVLRSLHELEELLEDLYLWFSRNFEDDEAAKNFFYRMSRDERGHKNLVSLQIRLLTTGRNEFGDVDVDFKDIADMIEEVRQMREAPEPPDLEKAVRFSLHVESSAAESYYRTVATLSNPKLAGLMGSLARENSHHYEKTREFAVGRGIIQ